MAMNDGTVSGTTGNGVGLAKEMYDAAMAELEATYPGDPEDPNNPPFDESAARPAIAAMVRGFATALVNHLRDNVEVTVDVNDSAHLDLGATTTGTIE